MPTMTIWSYEAECKTCGEALPKRDALGITQSLAQVAAFVGAHSECGFGSISATGLPYRWAEPAERGHAMLDDVARCSLGCGFETNLVSRMARHFLVEHMLEDMDDK